MDDKLTISIAMTTYNGERFIQEQLDSFLWQTRLPDELVVCDDGSTDRTLEILEAFSHKAPFPVRIYRNPQRLGFTKNFEKAALMCSGDLIAFSDQDDVWLPEKLDLVEKVFLNKNIGLLFHDLQLVDHKLRPLGYSYSTKYKYPKQNGIVSYNHMVKFFMKDCTILGCTVIVKKIYLSLPVPSYWSYDKWIPFVSFLCSPTYFINKKLIKYRQHIGQQYGYEKASIINMLNKTKILRRNHYKIKKYKWEIALKCIEYDDILYKDIRDKILAKIELLHLRNNIKKTKYFRFIYALRELILGRYHYYENGFKSFIKDLFF